MTFQIDLDQLSSAITGLQGLEATVERKLGELDATLASLHETWTGEAADAQRAAHERWTDGARDMHRALGDMRAAAQHAHGNYSQAAQTNAAMWRQVR